MQCKIGGLAQWCKIQEVQNVQVGQCDYQYTVIQNLFSFAQQMNIAPHGMLEHHCHICSSNSMDIEVLPVVEVMKITP